jgi:hypothetical protein
MLKIQTLAAAVTAALVTACGGGGGGGGSAPSSLTGKVIDGYITGAKVCLDVNSNLICDAGEPSAVTTAGGNYTLSYSGSLDGLRILAVVEPGPGVVDEDLGPIEKSFNLLAPAESASVVTPLTTMVAVEMSSKGMTAEQATSSIRTSLNLQAKDLLGYDFKAASVSGADKETLKIAQVTAAALSAVQEQIKAGSSDSLSSGEIFKAAVKQVKTTILPSLLKSDGTVNFDIAGKKQADLIAAVKTESNLTNVIQGQLQQIVASTKSGDGTSVDLIQAFRDGLIIAEKSSGDYINKSNVRVDGNWGGYEDALVVQSMKFDIAQLTSPPPNIAWVWTSDPTTGKDWYKDYESADIKHIFDGVKWTSFTDSRSFNAKPIISGNCLIAPISSDVTEGEKFCAVAKNLAGQKIKYYVPDICKDDAGKNKAGCDPEAVFPAGAIGYDFNISMTIDFYSFWADMNWDGYHYAGRTQSNQSPYKTLTNSPAPTLEKFVEALKGYPQWTGSGCSVGFMVKDYNPTTKTGTMLWGENTGEACKTATVSKYTDSTAFSIEKLGDKDILKTLLPNVYRKKNPGDGSLYKVFGIFPSPGNPGVTGIYSGDFNPKGNTVSIPFGNINSNTQIANKILFDAALPYININKPYPY